MTKHVNGGRGWGSDAAADSIHRIDSAFGNLVPITSFGRTWDEQNTAYYNYKYRGGPLALPPGSSVHESGNACDFGSSIWGWLGMSRGLGWNGARINGFGWRRTVSSEQWHAEYDENRDAALFQALLVLRGYSLKVDGEWGAASRAALSDYQGKNGLSIDGDFGPKSLAKLRAGGAGSDAQWPARALYGEPWVVSVQDKLKALRYDIGDSDGKDGPRTQAAVKDVQGKHGLTVDGVAGPATNAKLDELLAPAPVGRNATARPTVEIQKFLISKNYDLGQWGADGDYAAATTAAVIRYQTAEGLNADGVWGELTDARAFPPATSTPITQWPVNGRNATTRATKDVQAFIITKGISVGSTGADGVYGKDTSVGVAQWQSVTKDVNGKPLDVDGIWGPASDLVAFPGVALPDAPADPAADPSYGKKTPTYPGATWADVSPNKSTRTEDINYFVIHHRADTGTAASARKRFMAANDRNVSPNWNINQDGSVDEIVPPDDYRAWTTGAFDHKAVTVETGNTSGDPAWGISPESHEAIARLVEWASARYDFPIDREHVIGHREVPGQATACPGPSMDLNWIVDRAQEIRDERTTEEADDSFRITKQQLDAIHATWALLGQQLGEVSK